MTEGRLEVGLGLGYRVQEFEALGVPFKSRAARFDEILELLPALWTEKVVTHHGRFFDLDRVMPHIQPVQKPHPPLWIGGNSDMGAERAGRYGDAFPIVPATTRDQIRTRLTLVREGFKARGKAFGPQPLRRDVLIANDRETAFAQFERVAKRNYMGYAARENPRYSVGELEHDFTKATAPFAVVGTPDDVVESLREILRALRKITWS